MTNCVPLRLTGSLYDYRDASMTIRVPLQILRVCRQDEDGCHQAAPSDTPSTWDLLGAVSGEGRLLEHFLDVYTGNGKLMAVHVWKGCLHTGHAVGSPTGSGHANEGNSPTLAPAGRSEGSQ